MARVVLAMSGGVDSSASAWLLRQAGHDVIGLFMRHGEPAATSCSSEKPAGSGLTSLPIISGRLDHKQGCCTASDADDARRVADRLDIPFYALDFQEEFGRIIDYFVEEYTAARTPNPCVMCNNWLKFGKLFDYADSVGAEFVATGHYARLEQVPGEAAPRLLRGIDVGKDQSYVLFGVERRFLSRMMFPVGSYRKPEIRDLARQAGLRVADKRDSQEICFVSSGDHADFVRRRRGSDIDTSGDLVLTDGTVVGHHDGLEQFTIGQRKGLGLAFGEPRYVVRLEAETRRVVIGNKGDLARRELTANAMNWLVDPSAILPHPLGEGRGEGEEIANCQLQIENCKLEDGCSLSLGVGGGEQVAPLRCEVQIRYNSPAAPATVEVLPQSRLRATFDEPRHGVAPGQAVVCYLGDRVLGGGWIE